MQTSEIHPVIFSPINGFSWTQRIGYWLGRLWSLCTLPFGLIKRVADAAFVCFLKAPESIPLSIPPSPHNPVPSPRLENVNKEERQKEVAQVIKNEGKRNLEAEEPALDLDAFFYGDKENQDQTADNATVMPETPADNLKTTNAELTAGLSPKFNRFKRHRQDYSRLKKTLNLTSQPTNFQPKPSHAQTTDKLTKPAQPIEPIIIEAGGAGNCQLLSILKGLELQHPDILTQYQKSHKQALDAQTLRNMGVDFAREQIDRAGKYAENVLGYLDADRKEHNNAKIDPVEKSMKREKEQINRDFQNKKISQKIYNTRKQAHNEKYSKQCIKLEKEIIRTDEDFLNHLEKNGFYCSTLHLFALSIQLGVPIYVHEQNGIKDHDIQYFNPTDSKKEAIHLYRVANIHYQFLLFPQTTVAEIVNQQCAEDKEIVDVPANGNCLLYAIGIGLRKKYADYPDIQEKLQWNISPEQLEEIFISSKLTEGADPARQLEREQAAKHLTNLLEAPGKRLRQQAADYLKNHLTDEDVSLALLDGIPSHINAAKEKLERERELTVLLQEKEEDFENLVITLNSIDLQEAHLPKEEDVEGYIKMTENDHVYCGIPQIIALCKIYNIPIRVLYKYGKADQCAETYNEQANEGRSSPLPILTIAHVNNNHFKLIND